MKAIDPLTLAKLPRYEPLRAEAPPRAGTCVLCLGPIEPYDWRVRLPAKTGIAHTHCAGDQGWQIT